MTSDETQIQIFAADWPMSHAQRVTKDNRKNREYHVVAAIRNCLGTRPNHVKNKQQIGSEKTYGPKILNSLNTMMQRTANENAAGSIFVCGPLHHCASKMSRNGCQFVDKHSLPRYSLFTTE